ncbi:1-acyl-sn-glycerol-3-phosphate acyltransferase [Rhizobacter sp. Root404]|uniref:lysophospholipid acyltransferase family protein n=1 Tax=Rhizobacter sp. Root404 TaxID=1736528 RepID=UPI0006FCEB0F|nr:lysophospholipid acyltransferase family protein [Rhizobacter sp. Root404]KQW38334.1 lyso-ornithine lipid acyltransferase [Rhizobacter sp. Root404]
MTVGLRAAWRLLRCVLHALHGLGVVVVRFGTLDAGQRHDRIRWWSAKMLRVMGIGLQVEGVARPGGALLVANHVSWLDITALHAVVPQARFVSKADIQSWPLLSRLADAADTLYLQRERKRDALRVVHLVAQALSERQTVAVFPEGTTSDGRSLLPFHANILQAAISTDTPVQPVALRFSDACSRISPAVEFVGATTLVESLWRVACADGLIAHVTLLPARACTHADRRALAQTLRDDIETRLQGAD